MSVTDTDLPVDLAAAAVWGLVRSAQAETPGHHLLIDTDNHPDSQTALPSAAAYALATGEHQLALRAGQITIPTPHPHTLRTRRPKIPRRGTPPAPSSSPAAPVVWGRWSPGIWCPGTGCGSCC
ncbi:SpnB-like Rossmann fold domain-containing protein [Streptomyces sp. GLT-R25]